MLRALWNLLLRGDDESAPIAERDWYRAVLAEPDPERLIARVAEGSRTVKERVGGVFEVIRSAAPVDPDIAELWARIETEFYENQRAIVEALRAARGLRRGLDADRATDILWSLNHPDVWLLLVGKRGWSADEFERWLRETLSASCSSPAPGPPGAGALRSRRVATSAGRRSRRASASASRRDIRCSNALTSARPGRKWTGPGIETGGDHEPGWR